MRALTTHDTLLPPTSRGSRLARLAIVVLSVLGLAALAAIWKYTPLAAFARPERAVEWAAEFAARPWAPFAVVAAYTPASIVLFPRPAITLFAVLAFGAWVGFALALCGVVLAALATYAVGRRLDAASVRRIAGARLERLSLFMRRRGVLAMTAVRFVPLAPFAIVNVVAGAIRVRVRHFTAGTVLGILPGTLVATIFGDQLTIALRDPRALDPGILTGAVALLGIATWLVRRWIFHSKLDDDDGSRPQS